jgi:Flp pilus assembly protein protease CpaA
LILGLSKPSRKRPSFLHAGLGAFFAGAMDDVTLLLPLAFLMIAAGFDLRSRQIPDTLSVLVIVWGLAAFVAGWQPVSFWSMLGGLGVALVIGMAFFALGAFGGGDVKMLSALGFALGLELLVPTLFWIAVAGGLVAAVYLCRKQREVPYLPALVLGLLLFILIGEPFHALGL